MSRPRPPKLDTDKLQKRDNLAALKARLEQYEDLRKSGQLPTTFIAFDTIASLMGALAEGHPQQAIAECFPVEWGNQYVSVPAPLLKALATGWVKYMDNQETNLGKSFGLEGGAGGAHPAKAKQATRDRRRRLAHLAAMEYIAAGHDGRPLSTERVFEIVADGEAVSTDAVKSAWNEYWPALRRAMQGEGLLPR